MKELSRSLGVDMLTLKTLYSHGDDLLWEQSLPQNPEYLRYEYDARGKAIRKPNSCKKMWNHCTIFHDGVVVPCDYFLREEVNLGNMFSENNSSFRDIWFGKEFQTLRFRFLQGDYDGLHYQDCPLNFTTVDHYVSHIFHYKDNH
jgi:radical SAM protein with 4Fe4S-binding SPASM domain